MIMSLYHKLVKKKKTCPLLVLAMLAYLLQLRLQRRDLMLSVLTWIKKKLTFTSRGKTRLKRWETSYLTVQLNLLGWKGTEKRKISYCGRSDTCEYRSHAWSHSCHWSIWDCWTQSRTRFYRCIRVNGISRLYWRCLHSDSGEEIRA